MIEKGYISAILDGGKKVTVVPAFSSDVVSHELVVPFFLEKSLAVKMEVAYCWFQDDTGLVLARMDGDWSWELEGDVTIIGDVSTENLEASAGVMVKGISLGGHTHTDASGDTTSGPISGSSSGGPGGSGGSGGSGEDPDNPDESSASRAVLGTAILGSMILGEE